VAVSAAYEASFVRQGLNHLDECWPLYAAMRLHAGGTLYHDTFFVFPPGHLLPAWIAHTLDPPGVVLARVFYAAFNVAACAGVYALGRRLMPPPFALLAALLLAVAAPNAHLQHSLFGYRYLVWALLALLAFARWLESPRPGWLLLAGALAASGALFRIDTGLAAGAALAAGVLAVSPGWRSAVRGVGWLALGALAVAGPAVVGLGSSVGYQALWREVVVRPLAMTALQSKPWPELAIPEANPRGVVTYVFVAALFRGGALLYLVYGVGLAASWVRARRRREPFRHALLLGVVAFGGLFFVRSLGRSDEPHLSSALPPLCLLLSDALGRGLRPWLDRGARTRAKTLAAATVLLSAWVGLWGSDRPLRPSSRGAYPIAALGGASMAPLGLWWIDAKVAEIRRLTAPRDTILVLDPAPAFYLLTERPGPGGPDILMPGTFLDAAEEQAFVERLARTPPALVLKRRAPFDQRLDRGVMATAPRVADWVQEHYEPVRTGDEWLLMRPRTGPAGLPRPPETTPSGRR
jgi:hypothetical protein